MITWKLGTMIEPLLNFLKKHLLKHKLLDDVWGRLARKMTTDYPVEMKQENTAEQPNVQELPELPNLPLPSTSDAGKLEAKTDSPPKKKSALSFLFDEDIEICKVEPATPLSERISKEIDLYKKESRLPPTADPLMFWKKNSEKYPLLTRFAKAYLCVQATSVASERIFSTAGDIVTATRSCLDPDHVDRLIFLKKNYNDDKDSQNVSKSM